MAIKVKGKTINPLKLKKGSSEAKDYMKQLRAKRGKKKK